MRLYRADLFSFWQLESLYHPPLPPGGGGGDAALLLQIRQRDEEVVGCPSLTHLGGGVWVGGGGGSWLML